MKRSVIFIVTMLLLALPVMARNKKVECLKGDTVYSWKRENYTGDYVDDDFYNFYFSLKENGRYLHLFIFEYDHFLFFGGFEALFQWDKSKSAFVEMYVRDRKPMVLLPLCRSNEVAFDNVIIGKVRDTH